MSTQRRANREHSARSTAPREEPAIWLGFLLWFVRAVIAVRTASLPAASRLQAGILRKGSVDAPQRLSEAALCAIGSPQHSASSSGSFKHRAAVSGRARCALRDTSDLQVIPSASPHTSRSRALPSVPPGSRISRVAYPMPDRQAS
jgi:hypothetical protein